MATHNQALKRHRQSLKRRALNVHYKSIAKRAVKEAAELIENKDKKKIKEKLRNAESILSKIASKGVIPKKRASRKISRLAKKAHQAGL